MMQRSFVAIWMSLCAVAACNKQESSPPGSAASATSRSSETPTATSAGVTGAADTIPTSSGEVRIVPLQHASFVLLWNGKAIYADPAPGPSYDKQPKADVILVTDIHGDHMSPPTIAAVKKPDATIVAPPAVAAQLPPGGVVVLKNGESKQIAGIGVEAIPMYNLQRGPSAGQLYHDKGRGNGYVLTFGDKRFYLSGDTECTPEMRALKNIDVAFVCMNLPYTMPPSEAAECVKAFQPKILYPYHYRGSNLDELKAALGDTKTELRIRNWYP